MTRVGVRCRSAVGALAGAALLLAAQPAHAQVVALKSALVQVIGTPSPILLAPTRDADVVLRTKGGGRLTARFDNLRDASGQPIDATGNSFELEIVVNGGAPELRSAGFDIVNDTAQIEIALGLQAGDVVEIRRLDFYDWNGDRFATLGVRIQNPS